jgi:histidyl-tRNA synthetase
VEQGRDAVQIKAIRGFSDILPPETTQWKSVEDRARAVLETFGFSEIRVPILERAELFSRGIGEGTDIVEKEMYMFTDRGGDLITMRPEATASVVRAYILSAPCFDMNGRKRGGSASFIRLTRKFSASRTLQ